MTTGKISKKIDDIKYPDDTRRTYIGASSIGSDCLRQIWYEFNGEIGEPVDGRIQRIWKMGHILEGYVIDLIRKAGFSVEEAKDENNHHEWQDRELNYFKGHFDGLLVKENAILEVKTAKDASFKIFVKDGLKKWNPKYFAQVQTYMGMSGIETTYIIVLNKDTSELLDEKVLFNKDYYESLKRKAKAVYEATIAPPKVNGSPLWYQCKMCKFRKECHK